MKKPSESQTNIRVNAYDGMTEISIFNSRYDPIATERGFLSTNLSPGIYKVRWKRGAISSEKLIEVTGEEGDNSISLEEDKHEIRTSAPLLNSSFGSMDRPEFLEKLSVSVPTVNAGAPCQLLVFLREEAENEAIQARSVSIHTADGEEIANLTDGEVNADDGYAGIIVGAEPNVLRLRVQSGALGSYEIFVSTARNWQTRVFLTCDDFYYGSDVFRRPVLRTASILMARLGLPFDPSNRDARLAELSLGALLRGDDVLATSDMQDLLHGKFDDPMLGIYGAHLLAHHQPSKRELFDEVCQNLQRLVGLIPDVAALSRKAQYSDRSRELESSSYDGLPPMLVRSWDRLVKKSKRRYSAIPSGSLSDRIGGSIVSTAPWLMARVDASSEVVEIQSPRVSFAQGSRVVERMVAKVAESDLSSIQNYLQQQQQNLDPLENAILDAMVYPEDPIYTIEFEAEQGVADPDSVDAIGSLSDRSLAVSKLNAPSYAIARSAVSLASKLKGKFDFDLS